MENKGPIRWRSVLLVNLGMLGGCVVAVFTVPPTTRLSVFGFSCVFVLVALNIYLYFNGYRRNGTKPKPDPAELRQRRFWQVVLGAIVWAILLRDFVRYWWK